jgi:glycerol-3-phosphate dehydrogenase
MPGAFSLDAVVIGGGAAGLWTLDRLIARGYQAILLEAHELGSGQTVASQGIIHGGLKYTLSGMLTPSAQAIRDMPLIWRECLAGTREPKLTKTVVRSEHCFLWRTESIASRLGMIGARVGLRVAPQSIANDDRPSALMNCPGTVAKLDEQVIDPATLVADLAHRHRDRLLKIDFPHGISIAYQTEAHGCEVTIRGQHRELKINANQLILAAGAGNELIRREIGFKTNIMQRRPLHMVMLRGRNLPTLFGHCVDGAKTRVTITSAIDSAQRTVWQIGGQVAEDGVTMTRQELIAHTRKELNQSLAGFELGEVEWSTQLVDRAEHNAGGKRPDDVSIVLEHDGNLITVWPTKLALAPRAAELIERSTKGKPRGMEWDASLTADWPKPHVARPPWETEIAWFADA